MNDMDEHPGSQSRRYWPYPGKAPTLNELAEAIRVACHCEARYRETVPFLEAPRDGIEWHGVVEKFELVGHPRARHAYVTIRPDELKDGPTWRIFLEEGIITGPDDAAHAAMVERYRGT